MIDLKALAKEQTERTREIILSFPWENPQAYALWLAQTYNMVNHSTRLVALAGAYTPLDRNDLHARFVDHSKEERGHQLMCISDLKAIGYRIEDLPCFYQSAAMYQIQFYWIQHRNPVSFFGYTLALECLAAEFGAEIHQRTLKAHGKNATTFLRVHSEDDVDHIEKAYKQLNAMSEEDRKLIKENLELSAELYRSMLIEVAHRANVRPIKKVA